MQIVNVPFVPALAVVLSVTVTVDASLGQGLVPATV